MSDRVSATGLLRALGTLMRPDQFEGIEPSHRLCFAPRKAWAGGEPKVDVYLPSGPGPHPSVVLVHGGGFILGSRDMKPMRFLGSELVRRGYAVAVGEYRLLFQGVDLSEMVGDVVDLHRWWRGQEERFSLDPLRRTTVGLSAGACLALLSAHDLGDLAPTHVVCGYGLYDLLAVRGLLDRLSRPRLVPGATEAELRAASPCGLEPLALPVTLLHGSADEAVPFDQAERYARLREEIGQPTRLIAYPGEPHSFFNQAQSAACKRGLADLLEALESPPSTPA